MKPKSFSVTWIGPEFDGDFFWSVICAQFGMILNILGLIVEPWLSWLFWAVLVMSQRAKPKGFFFVKRPWWDLTQRRRFWRSCGGERQGELWCRSSLDEAQSWGLEMNPPNYRVAMVGVSMVNFESRYPYVSTQIWGSHPFVLSNSRADTFGWSCSLESPSWDPGRWLRTRFTLKNWWRTTRPLRWSEWHRLWIVKNCSMTRVTF